MNLKKVTRLVCALAMSISLMAGCGQGADPVASSNAPSSQPPSQQSAAPEPSKGSNASDERKQTLNVFAGGGVPANFNPLAGNPAWPLAYTNSTELVYETLFMYNMISGELEPLLGEKYTWVDDYTLKIDMNKNAKWSDEKPVTADDAVYTYLLGKKYQLLWSNYLAFVEDVVADGTNAFIIKLSKDNYNKLSVTDSLQQIPILPKHVWEEKEKTANNDLAEIRKDFNENPVGSGPYQITFHDDTKVTLTRNDKYWGSTLFGKLPAPKFINNFIYKDNNAASLAFKSGELDFAQLFIPQIWNIQKEAPVGTYLKDAPYYIPGNMPSLWINTTKEGLNNKDVRRAIAMCIDYKKISDVAMSGYSAKIEPSLNLLNEAEAKYVDKDAIKDLQWTTDVDGANKLLDSIGAAKGADGIRVLNGTRLGPWEVSAPYGWSDWNASIEIIVQNSKQIGIELRFNFPETAVWRNELYTGKFDISMQGPPNGTPTPGQPWSRARSIVYSKGVAPIGEQAFWNFGRYKNDRADQLIEAIPSVTDMTKLKEMYTELNKIWLTDVPTIPLMYRPTTFYNFNESVWTGFPVEGDGSNIPPQTVYDGSGVRALYKIQPK